jgi:hypothetical protein
VPDLQSGVNAEALSHEDYLNAPGESFSVTLDTPGSYSFYCEPHQGAGMAGEGGAGQWGRRGRQCGELRRVGCGAGAT